MVRLCKGICDGTCFRTGAEYKNIFSNKALQYDEGSYCSTCEVYIKQPTNSKLDAAFVLDPYKKPPTGANIAIVIEPNGKQVMLWLVPVLVKKVICKCCGTQCRGHTHAGKNNTTLRKKIFSTFEPKVPRAPRGTSNKTSEKKQKENIDYGYEESVFDTQGLGL